MKFLDKFVNHANVPWVSLTSDKLYSNNQTPPHATSPVGSFWWKDVLKFFSKDQELAVCYPNRGNTIMFWSNQWDGQALKDKFPHLYSFARKPKCSITFFPDNEEDRLFRLPLSQQAAVQLEEIHASIDSRQWDESVNDIWSYTWDSPKYSSKKAYSKLIGITPASPLFKWLWASSNLGTHKFFF
jgi:hypothetical protein